MKSARVFVCALTGIALAAASLLADNSQPASSAATTPPIYVPSTAHQNEVMPPNTLIWDSMNEETNAAAEDANAHFLFSFTNTTSGMLAILDVHPSCGCTTAQLPKLPWILPAGTGGRIPITVNLAGKFGTVFKTVRVTTDKGFTQLMLKINIQPPRPMTVTDEERTRGMNMARADRQAVFHGDCASCHVKPAEGKYGKALYDTACGICHEAEHRATMVPDLHTLKTPTNQEFWRTWIAHGKPGSLMPAFASADGGPLNDLQIASLAAYLNATVLSHAPAQAQ